MFDAAGVPDRRLFMMIEQLKMAIDTFVHLNQNENYTDMHWGKDTVGCETRYPCSIVIV